MDFSQFLQELGVYGHLTALLLGMPRLFALVTVTPFLGSAVVTGQIRLLLVLALYLPLHPVIVSHLTDEITLSAALSLAVDGKLALLLLKEAVLGLMIGFLAGIVFWTVQSAGFFMDNQRGASMAEGTDILSGDQSSPLGQLLFQSLVYIFYTSGAFLAFVGLVYASYGIWPVTQLLPLDVPQESAPVFCGKGRLAHGAHAAAGRAHRGSLSFDRRGPGPDQPFCVPAQRVCAGHAHQVRHRGFPAVLLFWTAAVACTGTF